MCAGGLILKQAREIGDGREQLGLYDWDRYTDSLAYSPSRGSEDEDVDSVSMQVMQELAGDQTEDNVTCGVSASALLDGSFPRQPLCCFLTGSDSTIETEDQRVPVVGSRVVPLCVRYCRARGNH